MITQLGIFIRSPLSKMLVIGLLILAGGWYCYSLGQDNVQAKWDIEKAKTTAEIQRLTDESKKITEKIVIEYVDKVKVVTRKGDTVVQYVNKYITDSSDTKCIIPKNAVLLHDMAAKNVVPTEKTK